MEELKRLIHDLSKTTYEIGSTHWVNITHIIDPNNFYICPVRYLNYIQKLESTIPTCKYTFRDKKELIVFRCTNPTGVVRYVRGWICKARILNDCNMLCDIFTVDYGHVEKSVSIDNIWKCNDIFFKIRPLAIICQLSNCFPIRTKVEYCTYKPEAIQAFKNYVLNEPAIMQVVGKIRSKLIVSLINSNTHDIATRMAIGGYSTVGHPKRQIAWRSITLYRGTEFKFKEMEIDQTLYVRMQSGTSLNNFYVADISDYENHLKETDYITYYAKRESVLCKKDIVKGLPVCVKDITRNVYERAVIDRVDHRNKNVVVQFVDRGSHEIFDFKKLKYMAVMCLRTPVLAIFCSAQDCNFWGDNLETFLTPGFEFLITIKNLGQGFTHSNNVEIHQLNKYLK